MLYAILTFLFKVFDSVLLTTFLLRFNGYKLKEKLAFFSLIPVSIIITEFFGDWFDILVVVVSILVSFIFMMAMNFNKTTKMRCLWSAVLFYGTLMIVNSIVYNVFQALMNIEIMYLVERTDIYVAVCTISKSILLLTIKTYIYLGKRLESKNASMNILNLFYTSLFNIVLIISIMRITTVELSFALTLVMVGLFVSGLIQYYMYAKLSGKARLELDYELLKQKNDSDKRLYKEKKEQFEDVARVNHDIKNHLMYIVYNIKNAKYEKAENYIEKIVKQLDILPGSMILTNDNLNFIINIKMDEAKRRGISMTAQIEDIQDCVIEDYDLCSLLGNILDNAIESAEKEKEKHIMIEIYNFSGYQIYSIKNRVDKPVLANNVTLSSSKKDKENHGYGMKQIQNIVNNYQGHIDIYEQGKYFNVKVLIPREI